MLEILSSKSLGKSVYSHYYYCCQLTSIGKRYTGKYKRVKQYLRRSLVAMGMPNIVSFHFSVRGERLKRWQWRDRETHVHAPPFQPITFGLSKQLGVRIMAQESIYLTFTEARRSVRFNVGTKVRVRSAGYLKQKQNNV